MEDATKTNCLFKELSVKDAPELTQFFAEQPPGYLTHFHPFSFDLETIIKQLSLKKLDCWEGVFDGAKLAGIYMLRGFDEGYKRPSFGLCIGAEYSGKGLGAAAMTRAILWCREHSVQEIMLKVHPRNKKAVHLYEKAGFRHSEWLQTGESLMTLSTDIQLPAL